MSYDTDKEGGERSLRDYWLGRIEAETEAHQKFRDKAKAARKAYEDKDETNEFPIFWSTIQVMLGALYAKEPKPDVRKRNSTDPKSADNVAQAIERAIAFFQDTEAFHTKLRPTVEDFLVESLGVAKVELVTELMEAPVIDPLTGEPIMDGDTEVTQQVVDRQAVQVRHWPSCQFRWEPAASWERVTWICFDHIMTREEIKTQFDIEVKDKGSKEKATGKTSAEKYGPTYLVHEIWDKETGRRIFVSDCHDDVLEVDKVPLDLEGFWPCAQPMMLGVPSNDLVPCPEYGKIKGQCEFIDTLSKRIRGLSRAIKDVGFFDASLAELEKLEGAQDGTRFPVRNLMDRLNTMSSGRASFEAVVADVDNTARAGVLQIVMQQREAAKNELFETLGLADIVRGASQASETATAQQIKGQWANVRLGPKIQALQYFLRDTLRIVGEVICEHLTPDEFMRVSGSQLTPEEYEAIKTDDRVYVVDIETDATLATDEQAEKQQRLEVLKTATDYLNGMLPAVQQGIIPADVAKEFVLFAIGSFKYGRQLQDVIQQLPGQAEQLAQAQQQIQQLTQQGEQAQMQLQEAQKALQQFQAGKEQRETMLAQADVGLKGAQTQKTLAEAQTVGVDAQAKVIVAQENAKKAQIEAQGAEVELGLKIADSQRREQEMARKAQMEDEDRQRKLAYEDEDRARAMQREEEERAAKSQPRRRRVRTQLDGQPVELEIEE